jgi:hypothetical protein
MRVRAWATGVPTRRCTPTTSNGRFLVAGARTFHHDAMASIRSYSGLFQHEHTAALHSHCAGHGRVRVAGELPYRQVGHPTCNLARHLTRRARVSGGNSSGRHMPTRGIAVPMAAPARRGSLCRTRPRSPRGPHRQCRVIYPVRFARCSGLEPPVSRRKASRRRTRQRWRRSSRACCETDRQSAHPLA